MRLVSAGLIGIVCVVDGGIRCEKVSHCSGDVVFLLGLIPLHTWQGEDGD